MGFLQFLQGVERQVNPLDNGRTFKKKTPANNKSTADQFFGFLKSAGVNFSNATNPAQAALSSKPVRDFATSTARAVPRGAATIGKSIGDVTNPALGLPKVPAFDPSKNVIAHAVLGTEPIQSAQERVKGSETKGINPVLAGLGTGLSIGGDILPVGPEKKAAQDVLAKGVADLAKAKTPQEVQKIMKGTPPEVVAKISGALAKTSDPHTITRILHKELGPKTPSMVPETPAPTSVTPGTPPEIIPPRPNPVQSVVKALQGQPAAKEQSPVTGLAALQQRQKELYSVERGKRLAKSTAASENLTGREAMKVQLGAQKNNLPRVNADALIEHLRGKVTPDDVNGILTHLQQNLDGYDSITAQKAITNLFDEGKLPRPHESKILGKALGPEFNNAIGSAAEQSLTKSQKVKNFAVELAGAPRSILAVDPSSAWLRQGAVLGARFPKEFFSNAKDSIKYLGSEKKYQAMLEEVNSRPTADIHDAWGIAKTSAGGAKREEPFQSTLAERIPIAGRVVRAADRGYTGFLTKLRADSTDHIIGNLEDAGINPRTEISAKAGKDIGRFINTASGRGNLGAFEKDAATLSKALFSPRLWKSRLDLLNPVYYAKLDPVARKYALQSAASFSAIAGTVLGLASLSGAHVETDARSSDFLKIKVGNTRYDILGGLQQNLVLAHRELPGSIAGHKTYVGSGEKKSSQSGRIIDLGKGDFGAADRVSILSDFVQNKENPIVSTGTRILKGKDQAGQKINPVTEIGKLGVPLGIQDTYQAYKDSGSLPKAILKSSPTNVGIGVGTYGTKDIAISSKQQKYVASIKDKGQQSATKLLLQTIKTAPAKDDVKSEIQAAMQKGDTNKAISLAKDFNKKYDSTFNDWFKKNGKYYQKDDNLIKAYRKGWITETTLERWDSALKDAKKGPSL